MKNKSLWKKVVPFLLVFAVLFSLINISLLQTRAERWEEAQAEIREKMRPAELQVIELTLEACPFCTSSETAVEELKSLNVDLKTVEKIDAQSAKGKELVAKYEVEKLPALIVDGELDKSERLSQFFADNGKIVQGRFIYDAITAPYYDVTTANPVGLVDVISLVDSSCTGCPDVTQVPKALKEQKVYVASEKTFHYTSKEAQELLQKYDIMEVPTVLISDGIEEYPLANDLKPISQKQDHYYIIPPAVPPYRDLKQDKILGLVKVIYLSDSSCTTCYNVEINKQILQRLGVAIVDEEKHDLFSIDGTNLRFKYNITKVPTIILSPEASAYHTLVQAWKSVGSIEEDGWFVMRRPEMLGTFKDLKTQEVVDPRSQLQQHGQ